MCREGWYNCLTPDPTNKVLFVTHVNVDPKKTVPAGQGIKPTFLV